MTNEQLVQLYQDGDKQALNKLVEENRGIVYKLVNKFYVEKTNSIDKEDLEQEGFTGLIVAANKYRFDVAHPCKFSTYAVYWIYQKIQRFVDGKNTNYETSLNIPTGENGDNEILDYIEGVDYSFENVEEKIYREQLRRELDHVMYENLSLKEREIVKLHYGWDNNKCMNQAEIGELYNATGSSIRNYENSALGKIRRSPWGARKAGEIYKEKSRKAKYNINKIIDKISFEDKYLSLYR